MATQVLTPSVLLVNDVLEERAMYARTLRAAGHRVITAEDSAVAYRIATNRRIDIVVTDVRITGSCSGLELTRRLKSDERTAAVGIVVLTSVSRSHDAEVALMAGADSVLEKPVASSLLTGEIRRLLSGSRRPANTRHKPSV
jgi:two-component system phosphate regulon response regulator PhoB